MINKNRLSSYILIFGAMLLGVVLSLRFFNSFVNSNFFLAIVTLLVGGVAISLYLLQRISKKRDAARIILQEIRRAEDIISDYKESGQYQFTKKIIATNSWARNIHYFVGDLDVDELDKISDLYSMGEYLDSIITKISDFNFDANINAFKNIFQPQTTVPVSPVQLTSQAVSGQQFINVPVALPAPWQGLLDKITLRYEPIYHSSIADKLKKIAKLK